MGVKKGYVFLIIIAAILWSLDGLLRRSLYLIPPITVVFLEHIFRLLILLPFARRFLPEYKKLTRRDWLIIIAIGVVSGAIATTMYTAALAQVNNISYSVVALLQQTQPVFVVLLAFFLLKEKITPRYLAFAVIALISAYFLTFPQYKPTFVHGSGELIAAILAVGAAFSWGAGTVLSKLILAKISYVALVIVRFAVVIPVTLIMMLFSGQTYPLFAITSTQWFNLLIIAFFSGSVGFVIYYKGLQHTEAKVATFAEFAWPLSAALIGYFFLHEHLSLVQILAGAILLLDILTLSLTAKEQ